MTRASAWSRPAGRMSLAAGLTVAVVIAGSAAAAAAARPGARAGTAHAAASTASTGRRTLRAWGLGSDGELGNGHRKNDQPVPVLVRLRRSVRVTSVRAGCDDAIALTSRGRAYAWGDNRTGELGDGSRTSTDKPVRVRLPTGTKLTAIRAGCRHNLALTSKGHVLAWGENALGQLGTGTKRNRSRPARVKIPAGTRIKAISAGCDHNLVLTTSGHVLAWGFNDDGQLGIGSHRNRLRPARVKFPGHPKIKIIAAGCDHSLAVAASGQLYGWGRNADGELGDGSTTERDTPERISLDGPVRTGQPASGAATARITALFGGNRHTLALLSNGFVLAWGDNSAGQLGDGMPGSSDSPVEVALPAGTRVTAISASEFDSMARTAGGRVLAWGDNSFGELGNGVPGNSDVPVRVALPAGLRAAGIGAGPGAETLFAITRKA
jgi:alpha-tubulin suppressor-like RCC1 family protein